MTNQRRAETIDGLAADTVGVASVDERSHGEGRAEGRLS